jgi:hypothetical protein
MTSIAAGKSAMSCSVRLPVTMTTGVVWPAGVSLDGSAGDPAAGNAEAGDPAGVSAAAWAMKAAAHRAAVA